MRAIVFVFLFMSFFYVLHQDTSRPLKEEIQTINAELRLANEINLTVAKLHERPFWFRFETGSVTSEPSGHGEKVTFKENQPADPYSPGPASYNTKIQLVPQFETAAPQKNAVLDDLWRWKVFEE